ncbi:unnamed protein product [Callosobruchus maculatus]|uniref:diphthine methyl ester synthase n=1 Tax=Callosobruchus maculatus TaxID=64391 RepID=A0A653C1S3_CALMS|nr:unnamed protein product [Callosobruchus maculatus]
MFFLIGLGLGDCKDITVKGLEIIRKCDKVYLESYTSILTCGVQALEEFYGKELTVADRDLVEQGADEILGEAKESDVALLVVGDPFGATTHTDLILRAKEKHIEVKCIHNASILSAVGCCGLQLYSFGETVSIPFWSDTWKPDSFFEKICNNYSMTKKKKVYMDPRFMSVKEAAIQLLEILKSSDSTVIDEKCLCIGLARVGSETQQIVACSLSKMASVDLGEPLHSLIVVGPKLHPLEDEYLQQFKIV